MNLLEQVRKKFKPHQGETDRADKSPSVSFVSSYPGQIRKNRLDPELERGIYRMAERWAYTATDLDEVLSLAAAEPAKWMITVIDEDTYEAKYSKYKLRSPTGGAEEPLS